MKHTATLFILLLLASGIQAQQLQLDTVGTSKSFSSELAGNCQYMGTVDTVSYFASREARMFNMSPIQIIATDAHYRTLKTMSIDGTKNFNILYANISNGEAVLLMRDGSEKKSEAVYRVSVRLDSMTIADSLKQMYRINLNNKGRIIMLSAVSPNGKYVGVVSAATQKNGTINTGEAMMYNESARPMWKKGINLRNLTSVSVTDDGTLITLGSHIVGQTDSMDIHIVSTADKLDYPAVLVFDSCTPVKTQLIGESNGVVLIGGFVRHPKVHAPGPSGLFTAAFNPDEQQLTRPATYRFSNSDFCCINNTTKYKDKKKKATEGQQRLRIEDKIPTTYGAAILLQGLYNVTTEENGQTTVIYHKQGSLLFGVGTDGNIRWHCGIRTLSVNDDGGCFQHTPLLRNGDNVYFVQNEHHKTTAYVPGQPIKALEEKTNSNLALYTITPTGEVSRQVILANTKWALGNSHPVEHGVLFQLDLKGNSTLMQLRY